MYLLNFLVVVVPLLLGVAFLTLLERKILSLVGLRLGPNKVSFMGLLQPIADAVKLSGKQLNVLSNFSFFFYYLSCALLMGGSIFLWYCYFTDPVVYSFKFFFLFFMVILSLNSICSIFCGWSTFSKYSLIGSLRTVSQLISYEGSLYFCLFFIFSLYFCFSVSDMDYTCLSMFSIFVPYSLMIWVPSFLAELNRTPYDFSEGESELVSGFNTEFGSKSFTLIFLAEYSNMIFFCTLTSLLFFSLFSTFFYTVSFFFLVWIRAVLPRYRFDKLMMLTWKFFIPYLTFWFLLFSLTF